MEPWDISPPRKGMYDASIKVTSHAHHGSKTPTLLGYTEALRLLFPTTTERYIHSYIYVHGKYYNS